MSNNNYFGEGIVFTISDYIIYFLLSSFYFWIVNLPLLLYIILSLINNSNNTLLLLIVTLPVYPALTALLASMGKLITNKTIKVTKEFFSNYKLNLKSSLSIGLIQNLILGFIYINNLYINSNSNLIFFHYLFLILTIIFLSINFYFFPILSRFYARKLDILKLSLFYFIKRPHVALICFALLYITYFIAYNLSFILSLVLISIFCYILMLLQNKTLLSLKNTIK